VFTRRLGGAHPKPADVPETPKCMVVHAISNAKLQIWSCNSMRTISVTADSTDSEVVAGQCNGAFKSAEDVDRLPAGIEFCRADLRPSVTLRVTSKEWVMPKIPNARPPEARCDPRLPQAALAFRRRSAPPLTSAQYLGAINITAWLYRDKQGVVGIQVNPNTTIAELIKRFGRAETPDAEVGFHSEMLAAEWFRVRPDLQVLQIFSERIPCWKMCAPMLRHYFSGAPWFYYYDGSSWRGPAGERVKRAGAILKSAYGL
jgi:hypothetical protein